MARGTLAAALLLLLCVGVGGALRLLAMERAFPIRPHGDELYYVVVATHLAQGRGHLYGANSRALRPPGYAWLLSHFVDASQPPVDLSRAHPALLMPRLHGLLLAQVLLATLLIPLTALLTRELFDARAALLAAGITALYPVFIAFGHYLWSETLFAVLVTAALAASVHCERRPSWLAAAVSGLLFGLAALTREIALMVAAAVALWWLWNAARPERRRALARGALALAVAAAVVLPWTLRNQRVLGRPIPVSTVGALALGEGNTLEQPRWWRVNGPARRAFRRDYFARRGELARFDFARSYALERIRAEQPGWIGKKLVRSLGQLLSPDTFLHYKIRNGAYGEPGASLRALLVPTELAYLLLVVAGVVGVASARGGGRGRLACLVFGCVAAVHVVANATSRFRMPWMPLLVAYASYALLDARASLRALRGRRWIAPALVLLVLAAACALHYLEIQGRV